MAASGKEKGGGDEMYQYQTDGQRMEMNILMKGETRFELNCHSATSIFLYVVYSIVRIDYYLEHTLFPMSPDMSSPRLPSSFHSRCSLQGSILG